MSIGRLVCQNNRRTTSRCRCTRRTRRIHQSRLECRRSRDNFCHHQSTLRIHPCRQAGMASMNFFRCTHRNCLARWFHAALRRSRHTGFGRRTHRTHHKHWFPLAFHYSLNTNCRPHILHKDRILHVDCLSAIGNVNHTVRLDLFLRFRQRVLTILLI